MTGHVTFNRTITLPDRMKIERYRRVPDLGPGILFFSGGTALRELSRRIIEYTHNSIHLITPFDSGGSSAVIRDAFNMISVGDLRNRLMSLADQNIHGNPDIYNLFAYRLPREENSKLIARLYEMIQGTDPLTEVLPEPMRRIISTYLRAFVNKMPLDFDLSGANIGNLILTGGYLRNGRDIDTIIFIFSKLVEARGIVRPVVNSFLHLVAELDDGTVVAGQHNITGKEQPPIESPVKKLFLTDTLVSPHPVDISIDEEIDEIIRQAELICYPMGSFYTSVIANLLPGGVGRAVAANRGIKIYIPNTTPDPEQLGMDLVSLVEAIVSIMQQDKPDIVPNDVLNFVIIDKKKGNYPFKIDEETIREMGIEVIDAEIISRESSPHVDPGLMINILLSLT